MLKLTKSTNDGIEPVESEGEYTFNVGPEKLIEVIDSTLLIHKIRLPVNECLSRLPQNGF